MSRLAEIRVYLYGKFRQLAPDPSPMGESYIDTTCFPGEQIGAFISRLGIKPEDVSHVFLNGEYSTLERRIGDGDRLGLFPKEMSLIYRQYFPRKGGE